MEKEKGIVAKIEDQSAYGTLNVDDLEKLFDDLSKRSSNGKRNSFDFTEYCSLDQFQELRTGSDIFDRAIMCEAGFDDEILKRDIREFLSRNSSIKDRDAVNYRRCKEGYMGMSGDEYFYLNYCRINGELPLEYTPEALERYQVEVARLRGLQSLKFRRFGHKPSYFDLERRMFEKPKSPEECFRLKNKLEK